MPLPPKFLQRIKDRALDKILERVDDSYAVDDGRQEKDEEELPTSFVDRIRTRVEQKLLQLSPTQRALLNPARALDQPTLRFRVRYCAQNRLLAMVRYNNVWRMVAVYSYRMNGKPAHPGGPATLRLYGECMLHAEIHSFVPEKITGFVVTDTTYNPKWPIEI